MPFLTLGKLVEQTGRSTQTLDAALADLEGPGNIDAITGSQSGRVCRHQRELHILSAEKGP